MQSSGREFRARTKIGMRQEVWHLLKGPKSGLLGDMLEDVMDEEDGDHTHYHHYVVAFIHLIPPKRNGLLGLVLRWRGLRLADCEAAVSFQIPTEIRFRDAGDTRLHDV